MATLACARRDDTQTRNCRSVPSITTSLTVGYKSLALDQKRRHQCSCHHVRPCHQRVYGSRCIGPGDTMMPLVYSRAAILVVIPAKHADLWELAGLKVAMSGGGIARPQASLPDCRALLSDVRVSSLCRLYGETTGYMSEYGVECNVSSRYWLPSLLIATPLHDSATVALLHHPLGSVVSRTGSRPLVSISFWTGY